MATQFLTFYEETTRGVAPGVPNYLALPVSGNLEPDLDVTEAPRVEFRPGGDSSLGSSSVQRTEIKWSYVLKCRWYPGKETGLLFKHLLGKVTDLEAVAGVTPHFLRPVPMPYGAGYPLANKAIAIVPNTDEGPAGTKSRVYGGGRVTQCKISAKGTEDVMLEFTIQGAWIGPADQAMVVAPEIPASTPYSAADIKLYIGSGISRTGDAPDFTALDKGTMLDFGPDSLDITIDNGLKDKIVMGSGVLGPTKTYREAAFKVDIDCPIDYADPAAGFSSADEFKKLFDGPVTNSLLVVLDNGEDFTSAIDLPYLSHKNPKSPERNAEGKQPSLKMGFTSLVDPTIGYPVALLNEDEAATY